MNVAHLNTILDLFSLAVVVMIVKSFGLTPGKQLGQTRIFFTMCCVAAIMLILDIIACLMEGKEKFTLLNYVVSLMIMLFFQSGSLMVLLLTNSFIEPLNKVRKTLTFILKLAFALLSIVTIVGTFLGWFYSITDGKYEPYNAMIYAYVLPLLTIIGSCGTAILNEKMSPIEKLSFAAVLFFSATGTVFQILRLQSSVSFATIVLALLAIYIGIFVQRSRRLAEVENELSRKRMSVMISQMQPHFLFNSLTTIMDLCDRDPKMAKQAISDFSDYLRGNLDAMSAESLIPFEQELEHCKTYLGFEKLRFEDTLHIVYDIHYTDFFVPPLSIQPLLENAVKHGVGHKKGGGIVMLTVEEAPSEIIIRITDDGVGFDMSAPPDPKRSHVGIENIRSRLSQMCGGKLRISSNPGTGTTAVIRLPKEAH